MARKGSTESKPLIITLVFVILALIGVSVYLYILIGEREQYRSETAKAKDDAAIEKEVAAYHKFVGRLLMSYLTDVNDDTRRKIEADRASFNSGKPGWTDPEKDVIKGLIKQFDNNEAPKDAGAELLGDKDPLKNVMPKDTNVLTRNWGKDPAKGIDLTGVNKNFSAEVIALRKKVLELQGEKETCAKSLAVAEKELKTEKDARAEDKADFTAKLAKKTEEEDKAKAEILARVEKINKNDLESQDRLKTAMGDVQKEKTKVAEALAGKAAAEKERDDALRHKEVAKEDFLRFEKPRGEVLEVQRGGNVILKMPSTKNLEPGMTLSVRGVNQQGKPLEVVKGNLKVTEVGPSFCVATILEDDKEKVKKGPGPSLDPIVKGDQVYSLSWDPEQQKRVVLVGVMDNGGPGIYNATEANRQMVDLKRNLERQGMKVDAYMDMNTFKLTEGKIGIDTDYLVLGRVIDSQKTKDSGDKTMGDGVNDAVKDAIRNGVLIVPLRRFMAISGSPLPPATPREGYP